MPKELQRLDESTLTRMYTRELIRMKRQRVGLFWFSGGCLLLSVGAIVVVSFANKDLTWLTNILLALSPIWIITGLLGLISGFIGLMMIMEIETAEAAVAEATALAAHGS